MSYHNMFNYARVPGPPRMFVPLGFVDFLVVENPLPPPAFTPLRDCVEHIDPKEDSQWPEQ